MKQESFEKQYGPLWARFQVWVDELAKHPVRRRRSDKLHDEIAESFPVMYRQICHHLALARARCYSLGLQQRLNSLALDGHRHLYRSRTPYLTVVIDFLVRGFPGAFRQHWRFMAASGLFLFGTMLAMALAVQMQPELVYSMLEPSAVASMESMYDPSNSVLGRERETTDDIVMFGFYIYNNVTIGFQTFAGGLAFGLGSIFYLVFNGLTIGAVASHLTAIGYTETFWTFVAGHSAFELTAIMVFGGAGLAIGFSAVAPGRKTRWQAIRDSAVAVMPLLYGGAIMLFVAAFIEAYWSSTTWPAAIVKYSVGIALWILHGLYFGLMGRREPR
ncbi:MAG: stage II sporulation protein M [Pseudomonadota bacterium]